MAWEYAEVQKANLNMQNFGTLEHSNWIRQILWSQLFSASALNIRFFCIIA